MLAAVENRLKERRWQLHQDHADHGLAALRDELAELLAAAAPVLDQLDGIDSAEGAILADRATQWRQAGQLATRYAAIRAAQGTVVSNHVDPAEPPRVRDVPTSTGRRLVVLYGTVQNPREHFPALGEHAADRAGSEIAQARIVDQQRLVISSHSERPASTPPWSTGDDPLAALRFLVRPGVVAWLPSTGDLLGVRDADQARRRAEARAAAGAPDDEQPQSLIYRSGRDPRAHRPGGPA